MRIWSRQSLRAAVIGLALVAMLATVVGAVLAAPTLTLSPKSGPRDDGNGNQTVIHGSGSFGFAIGSLDVYWEVADANHLQTPAKVALNQPAPGDYSFDLTIPLAVAGVAVRPGGHSVIAQACPQGINCIPLSVSATFTVSSPTVSLTPSQGRQLAGIFVNGNGFSPSGLGESVQITWDAAGSNQQLYFNNPGQSTFQVPVTIPDVPAGTYKIRVCDVRPRFTTCAAAADTVSISFTIVPPILTLDHSSGLAGATFNASGSRWHGSRELHIWFGTTGNPKLHEILPGTPKQTNSDGFFGPYPYAPADPPGSYVVTACTYNPIAVAGACDPNDIDTAPYTILAPATPTPSPTTRPTVTPLSTATPPPTATPAPTPSPTPTPTAQPTPSPTTSAAATATASLLPTASPIGTASSAPTSPPPVLPSPTPPQTVAPTSAPIITAAPPAPSPSPGQLKTWPEHLQAPGSPTGGISDLATIGGIGLLALLIAFLVPFPGTLFNKTVEANYGEIQGWIAGGRRRWNALLDRVAVGPLGGVRRGLGVALQGRFGVVIFLVLSALVYGFLSPTFGFDFKSAALFLGLLVGLTFVTAAFDLPLRIYHGRRTQTHDRGVLRSLWWTLLIAVVCVSISRLAGFQPGYLYGLIISIVFVTEISAREEGIGTWLASAWLLVLSFVAWVALAFVRQANADPWVSLFLQTVLVTFVVAGIETLAIGLLPMRFLPGHPLFRWRKGMWFALFALSVFGYLLILVDPANGYLSSDSSAPMLVGVIFLLVFGVISVATWAYFRYRPARVGGDRPGEAEAA